MINFKHKSKIPFINPRPRNPYNRFLFLIYFALIALLPGICTSAYALDLEKVKFYLLEGDYKSAISEGEKIMATTSSHASGSDELYYLLGLSYMKDGNLLRASDIFEIILKEYKNSKFKEEAKLGLGDTYLLRGDLVRAEECYKELLKENPNTKFKSQIYYRLSESGFKKGETDQGKDYLGKLKQAAPLNTELGLDKNLSTFGGNGSDFYYTVQVGAFTKKQNAENLTRKLIARGYPAYIEEVTLRGVLNYRVKVGKSGARKDASELEKKLSQEGYPTKVCP